MVKKMYLSIDLIKQEFITKIGSKGLMITTPSYNVKPKIVDFKPFLK